MERKRHKVNYLSGFDKKRVVSQYAAKYVTLLSLSPQPTAVQRNSAGLFSYVVPDRRNLVFLALRERSIWILFRNFGLQCSKSPS